jgi:uncharacterized protein (DUF3820 family)/uncharacterized protein YbaR (Trm112 family)
MFSEEESLNTKWGEMLACPVCKSFYLTMDKPIYKYGKDSGMAWQGRGDSIEIPCACQMDGEHSWVVRLGFHKGQVYVKNELVENTKPRFIDDELLYCNDCGQRQPFVVKEKEFRNKTIHHEAYCMVCDKWLKLVPQNKPIEEIIMPFGKYKGTKLVEIPKDYFEFIIQNNYAKGNLKKQIESLIK